MAKGVFTPTELVEVQTHLDDIWGDASQDKFYKVRGESVRAVLDNQTARFIELQDPTKEKEVAVLWADWCDQTAKESTNANTCENTDCDEADPKAVKYKPTVFIDDCFIIKDADYKSNYLDQMQVTAKGFAAKIRNIVELLNSKVIAKIDAASGINPFAGSYQINGNTTEILKGDFTIEKFYPYLMQVMALLRSENAYILDGQNLFQAKILADNMRENADGKLDSNLFAGFPYYNDILGFAKAGVADKTYAVDYGAVALQSRRTFPEIPQEGPNKVTRYYINLGAYGYPELDLDVQYQMGCDTSGEWTHSWKFKLRAVLETTPILCEAGNTGIQSFTSVTEYSDVEPVTP